MAQPPPHYLPSLQGRLFLHCGNPWVPNAAGHDFILDNEGLRAGRQLPQFLPRIDWPNPPYTIQSRQAIPTYDTDHRDPHLPAQNAPVKVAEVQRARNVDYRNLQPPPFLKEMGPFDQGDYRGKSWHEHVTHCHNVLIERIPNHQWLSDVEMQSLLTIASYGLDETTCFLEHEFLLHGWSGRRFQTECVPELGGQRLAQGIIMPNSDFMVSTNTRRAVRESMCERRWIVAPVMTDGNHWCMTIFDRESSALYILDTMARGRDRRIEGICHLWARFWNRLGLPYHFRYFAPRTLEQSGTWECGYLGVVWVMHNLRNGVGQFIMNVQGHNVRRRDIAIGNHPLGFPDRPSRSLSHWQPRGYPDHMATEGVMLMLSAALCNELGISDHDSMANPPPNAQLQFPGSTQGAYDRIIQTSQKLKSSGQGAGQPPTIDPGSFWTSTGGPQFSWGTAQTSNLNPGPTARREYQPSGRRSVIEYRGLHLLYNPPIRRRLWNRAAPLTADAPLVSKNNPRKSKRTTKQPSRYGDLKDTEEALKGVRGTGSRAGRKRRR